MWVVICSLFFLSGVTSLVYETIWIRVISLGVGSTSAAMSIVLGLFFLGLSLGSWLSSRWITKYSRPLLIYAVLEGLIGLVGVGLIYGLIHFHSLLALFPLESSLSFGATLVKFFLVGLLIFVPTVAMGATLPLIVKLFHTFPGGESRSVSLLYAINTLGGVAGAVLAAFVLIPQWGILLTNQACALANFVLCGAGIWLDRKLKTRSEVTEEESSATHPLSRAEWELVILSGICGFASLASQVVWNKYLGIYLGNNIYGLGIVLGIYLLGIALGSLILFTLLPKMKQPKIVFWWCLFLLPLSIALTSYAFNWVPVLSSTIGFYTAGKVELLAIKSTLSAFLLMPSTLLLGFLFPLTVDLISTNNRTSHRAVGVAYAVNTVGAILGSCLAGLVFIPVLGSSHTIRIAAGVLLLGGAYVVCRDPQMPRKRFAALSVVSLAIIGFFGSLDFRNIIKSAYIQKVDPNVSLADHLAPYSEAHEDFKWIREGETSVITLSQDPSDGEHYKDFLRLKTNGLNESVYVLKRLEELPRYEALLGLLPYLFSNSPKSAFVVGYGGGYTVDLLTSFPIEKVNVVELEEAIMEAQDKVYLGKNPILRRKNLDLTIEDARFVLASKQKAPLDIIVSQPSHSWLAGAANLFTKEFFEIVKANLSPQGVFSQWLNLYNMDVDTLKSLLATFFHVFPHGAVFSGQGDQEMILIGSMSPLQFNTSEAQRIASSPRYQRRLAAVPFNGASDIIAHFALGREQIREVAANSVLNTDINAYAETRQSKSFYRGLKADETPRAFLATNYKPGFTGFLDTTQDWAYNVLLSLQQTAQFDKFYPSLWEFERKFAGVKSRHAQLGYLCQKSQRYDSAHYYLSSAFAQAPTTNNFVMLLGSLVELERFKEVVALGKRYPQKRDSIAECYQLRSLLALGRTGEANPIMAKMVEDIPGYTAACGDFFNLVAGDYYFQTKQYPISISFYEAFHQRYAQHVPSLQKLSVAYLNTKQWEKASALSEALRATVLEKKEQLNALAAFYRTYNLEGDAQALQTRASELDVAE